MIEVTGDLFTSTAPALGHGVNTVGLMGAGIAKTMREKFPHNYENYHAICKAGNLPPGGLTVTNENGKYIINMASQKNPGKDASYAWLFESALTAAVGAVKVGMSRIAIPEIGCGIGGLEWWKVEEVLRTVEMLVCKDFKQANDESSLPFNWEVWHYEG